MNENVENEYVVGQWEPEGWDGGEEPEQELLSGRAEEWCVLDGMSAGSGAGEGMSGESSLDVDGRSGENQDPAGEWDKEEEEEEEEEEMEKRVMD